MITYFWTIKLNTSIYSHGFIKRLKMYETLQFRIIILLPVSFEFSCLLTPPLSSQHVMHFLDIFYRCQANA